MSFGHMNTHIDIISTEPVKDKEGFVSTGDRVLASVRAYHEQKHGSTAWANRASFSTATALFRFRRIPGVEVAAGMVIACDRGRFKVTSVEDIKGRKMYTEALAEEVLSVGTV